MNDYSNIYKPTMSSIYIQTLNKQLIKELKTVATSVRTLHTPDVALPHVQCAHAFGAFSSFDFEAVHLARQMCPNVETVNCDCVFCKKNDRVIKYKVLVRGRGSESMGD